MIKIDSTLTALGNRIRRLRISKNMSQEELAFRSDLNPAHLGQIERALKNPTIKTVEKIADSLEVPMSSLLSFHIPPGENDPSKTTFDVIVSRISNMTDNEQKKLLTLLDVIENFHNN